MKIAIIGSSFSSITTAIALVRKGHSVLIFDVGETLKSDSMNLVNQLKFTPQEEWSSKKFSSITQNNTFNKLSIPKKLHFGDDYIYANSRPFSKIVTLAGARSPFPTFAKGGYSNIWGGASLPIDSCDMSDWPIKREELTPYFKLVEEFMPICHGEGNLARSFPINSSNDGMFNLNQQSIGLLNDMKACESKLLEGGSLFGISRLALYTKDLSNEILSCNSCGACFMGCPRNSIFSTTYILEKLIRENKIEYHNGFYVDSVDEIDGKAIIYGLNLYSNEKSSHSFDKIFLGCGPIGSTRILMKSKKIYASKIILKESQKFILPIFRYGQLISNSNNKSPSLASIFFETKCQKISNNWVHSQIIAMNSMIIDSLNLPLKNSTFGKNFWLSTLSRFMVSWTGMHSDHSSALELSLKNDNGQDSLILNAIISKTSRQKARLAAKEIYRQGLLFNTLFLYPLIKFSNPGSGTHCGGSFPMTSSGDDSKKYKTDLLGRPFGWQNIHVVDASVLPSIPGTTITFTVMANAYRIADLAIANSRDSLS